MSRAPGLGTSGGRQRHLLQREHAAQSTCVMKSTRSGAGSRGAADAPGARSTADGGRDAASSTGAPRRRPAVSRSSGGGIACAEIAAVAAIAAAREGRARAGEGVAAPPEFSSASSISRESGGLIAGTGSSAESVPAIEGGVGRRGVGAVGSFYSAPSASLTRSMRGKHATHKPLPFDRSSTPNLTNCFQSQ